ncbi:uncharacterized protein LOC128999595 [Macrosteles quadrilineatus]|uniref:uncharacterized protein LOC128999595 n=1 Tax=Macrosteles quadrilineatus TaxID=74068 RepID=UPI0023E09990|nr:uncharacterized protein LOC128999595 [Macrosteles quadrilineatus]XP_054282155.1 uncharacterized protein LOC128999595 [Macrosteles quadrilineatus]
MEEDAGRSPKIFKKTTTAGNVTKCCNVSGKHTCVFRQGPVSLTALAHSLCAMSKSITSIKKAIQDSHTDIIRRLPVSENPAATEQPRATTADPEEEGREEDSVDIFDMTFPLKSMEDFILFEEKLKDKNFKKNVMKGLISIGTGNSSSRATTSVLRFTIHPDLVKQFSWKGQRRLNKRTESFSKTLFSKYLIDGIKKNGMTSLRRR